MPKRDGTKLNSTVRSRSITNRISENEKNNSDNENKHSIEDVRNISKSNDGSSRPCIETSETFKLPLGELNENSKSKFSSYGSFKNISLKSVDSPVSSVKSTFMGRKSVEENNTTPKSLITNLNSSHPPWNYSSNSACKNVKFISRPVIPGTPKRTIRIPENLEMGNDKGGISSSNFRNSTYKLRASTESKNSPSSLLNTPCRNIGGSTQKHDSKRQFSTRKSFTRNTPSSASGIASSLNRSPSFHKRLSSQEMPLTPMLQAESPDLTSNVYDIENQYDESSSTVSVGVRVRPINSRELQKPNVHNIISVEGNEITVNGEFGSTHHFAYDFCFNSCTGKNYATQKHVYETMARPLLFHAYEGYNVCLFAYGQTGSGKSYCIMGESDINYNSKDSQILCESVGIIPRFCQELFAEADSIHAKNKEKDIQCRVVIEISYIEIYNEKIYDLIGDQNIPRDDEQRHTGDKREPLRVREHPQHGPYVVGASCYLVSSYQDLETWVVLGDKQRSIAATALNDKSSRSHSVFSVKLTQTQSEVIQGEEMEHSLVSVINLVDLAGSERVAASNSEGDRLKEGVCINKSLLSLGKVITALAESNGKKKIFIPYRESTLTWLLKESLGGNSKTAMIATISPCSIHQEESLSTLRYAQQARKIVNWNRINEDQKSKIIRALKLEIERLRALQIASPKMLVYETEEDQRSNSSQEDIPGDPSEKDEEVASARLREQDIINQKEREINLLREKMIAIQEQFSESTKLWEDKMREAESSKREALERCRLQGLALKVEGNEPTLVTLCEDPQLSQTLLYNLRKGATTLGTSDADVTLSGLHDTGHHCSIFYEGDKLVLYPKKDTETFVNGKLVSAPTQIFHNDRIILSGIYFFRVCFPSLSAPRDKSDGRKFDFLYAKDELLKEQEERIRREMDKEHASTKAEMLLELEVQRSELKMIEMEMKENVNLLSTELEEERHISQKTELAKLILEEEKEQLEHQIRSLKKLGQSSDRLSQASSPNEDDSFFRNMEKIFNESIQTVETSKPEFEKLSVEVHFLMAEANNICSELKKPFRFQQQSRLQSRGFETAVVVHDFEHNLCAFLDVVEFKNVLDALRDLALNVEEDNSLLETLISWERSDEATRVSVIQNKLRENARRFSISRALNTSLNNGNFPLNNSSLLGGGGRRASGRRSTLSQCPSKSSSTFTQTLAIAKAASQVLPAFSNDQQLPIFFYIISKLLCFEHLLKDFLAHYREAATSSDGEEVLNKEIIEITVLATSINDALSRLRSELFHKLIKKEMEVSRNLNCHGRTFLNKVTRMLKGVEKEAESLVEEENSALIKLIHKLVEEIGFLNVISSSEIPDGTFLTSSLLFCRSYLDGVSRGLEWFVKRALEASEAAAVPVNPQQEDIRNSPHEDVLQKVKITLESISAFLRKFSSLKVVPSIEPTMSQKEAKRETTSFLSRVTGALGNIEGLTASMESIKTEMQNISKGSCQASVIMKNADFLRGTFGELVDDAGVGKHYEKRRSNNQGLASSIDISDSVLDELHKLAKKVFQNIYEMGNSGARLTWWEFETERERVKRENSEQVEPSEPLKSSLKSGPRTEGKKVHFNVSLGSTLSGSILDDEDDQSDSIDL